MRLKEISRETFFESEEATTINNILIDIVGHSGLSAAFVSLGYDLKEIERAKNIFKIVYKVF